MPPRAPDVHTQQGESSGQLTFPLEPMTTVDGRPMLAALQMLLGPDRLFEGGASNTRLRPLMEQSPLVDRSNRVDFFPDTGGTVDLDQRQRIASEQEGWLRSDALNLLVVDAKGWAEHDARLPLLQGASRGLQLAATADLPLFGSCEEKPVLMLTLTALEEGSGLRIRTEVVEVPVWTVPMPGGERLELVVVPEGPAQLG